MKIKNPFTDVWKFVVLLAALTALTMAARGLLPRPAVMNGIGQPDDPLRAIASLLLVYGLYALTMQFIARNARTGGWRLFLALASLYVGTAIMMQIETLFFGQAFPLLPPRDVLLLLLNAAVVGTLFSVLVITVEGRWKKPASPAPRLIDEFKTRWPVIAASMVLYPIIYFVFGYCVAYGNHAAVEFYRSVDATRNQFVLVGFQAFRGALWAGFALITASVLEKREHAVAVLGGGLPLFSCLALIFENPIMPEAVRYAHGFEIATSMTLFGLVLALIPPAGVREANSRRALSTLPTGA